MCLYMTCEVNVVFLDDTPVIEDLNKRFGAAHEDGGDDPAGWTQITFSNDHPGCPTLEDFPVEKDTFAEDYASLSIPDCPRVDIDSRFHPGVICFHEVQVYTLTNSVGSFSFSGLRCHDGAPPVQLLSSESETLSWWYREITVPYSVLKMMEEKYRYPLIKPWQDEFDYFRPDYQFLS